MPRKTNKSYYDHDDRTGGSGHNIRKVSFMHGSGRIRKNRRNDALVMKYIADDDVQMGGVGGTGGGGGGAGTQPWKGGKPRKYFKKRAGSPGIRTSHQPKPLRPTSEWFQVRIPYGAKYGKSYILQVLLKQLSPKVFIPNSYLNDGKDAVFYVNDFDTAVALRNSNKKIRYDDGFMMELRVKEGVPPPIFVDDSVKEQIKVIMAKRYIAENKALDLSKFSSDPDFQGLIYCPLSRPSIMKAVWQIISENIADIVALNLTNNKIAVMDESSSVEIKKLKNLRILHLGENKIKSLHVLNCLKDLELSELVLKDNPITEAYKDSAHYVRYGSGVTLTASHELGYKVFHSCTPFDGYAEDISNNRVLNEEDEIELPPVISFDVVDDVKLPAPQPAFMCNPEGRGIVKAFLSQYFALYDSDNRLDLAQAYHDNSSFSICAYYPPNQKVNYNKLYSYMQESRNLFRVQDYPRRKKLLRTGKQNIVQFLSQLPKTQHDLSSFVVDLVLFTPALLNLSVSGVFREPNFSTAANLWTVRHFSRTFLIVPVNQGFCIINEILFVTNATDEEIESSFKEETQNAAILQSPSSSQQPAADVSAVASAMQSVQLDDSVRLQMVQTLATRTGMNLEWSKKCLDETQWDFDRAIWTFTELQSKGTIPAEAFVK